jgi:hypothetical protein
VLGKRLAANAAGIAGSCPGAPSSRRTCSDASEPLRGIVQTVCGVAGTLFVFEKS